jgi:hypothetical protein
MIVTFPFQALPQCLPCIRSVNSPSKSGYTLATLPRIVTQYRDIVDETRVRVAYQKLVRR